MGGVGLTWYRRHLGIYKLLFPFLYQFLVQMNEEFFSYLDLLEILKLLEFFEIQFLELKGVLFLESERQSENKEGS